MLFCTVLPRLQPFFFGDEPAFVGDSATVQCSLVSGDMPVEFSWLLNGKSIEEINGINVGSFGKKTSVLSIDSVYEIHAGNYTCVATNKAGISTYTTELVVKGIYNFTISFFNLLKPFPFYYLQNNFS